MSCSHNAFGKGTIALLIPSLYGGGAEKVAADMSIFLSDEGYRVLLFVDEFDKNHCYYHRGEVCVIHTDSAWCSETWAKKLYHCLKRGSQYRQYKRQYNIDISISFMVQENLTNILSDIGDKKILTVHSVTSAITNYEGQLFIEPFVFRKLYPKADAIITVSKFVKWDLEKKMGLHHGMAHVIYNSVDIASLKRMATESIDEESENLILYVGRLDDEKRPWIAVRVMQEIVQRVRNAKLLMLGDGENKRLLQQLIQSMHLSSNVKMLGFEENVAKYMVRAKVLLVCSESEAFSCVLAEALTLGLPAVVADCPGGVFEVMTSRKKGKSVFYERNTIVECGVITPKISVNKQNAKSKQLSKAEKLFAKGVCMLLEDVELRNQLSMNAKKRAQKFSQALIKNRWLTLLERIRY